MATPDNCEASLPGILDVGCPDVVFGAELPPPVLADLLGLTVQAAQRWASYTQPDWAAYLEGQKRRRPESE